MYTTKLRNKKDSPFRYAKDSKEDLAQKKKRDDRVLADKAYAERYGKPKKHHLQRNNRNKERTLVFKLL